MTSELNREHLCVCEHCLYGIESHEGSLPHITVWVDDEDPVESRCDWCEEDGFDVLYELI